MINWHFNYNENISIVESCNRKDCSISINLKAVDLYYSNCQIRIIEYFLLHEIRHLFQCLIIKDYMEGNLVSIDEDIVKRWIYENDNYIKAINNKGEEDSRYFDQDIEMDAFAYSYSVMKYKYQNLDDINLPPYYGNKLDDLINEWIETFIQEEIVR